MRPLRRDCRHILRDLCPYCGYRLAARKPTGMDPLYGMTDSEFYKRFGSM